MDILDSIIRNLSADSSMKDVAEQAMNKPGIPMRDFVKGVFWAAEHVAPAAPSPLETYNNEYLPIVETVKNMSGKLADEPCSDVEEEFIRLFGFNNFSTINVDEPPAVHDDSFPFFAHRAVWAAQAYMQNKEAFHRLNKAIHKTGNLHVASGNPAFDNKCALVRFSFCGWELMDMATVFFEHASSVMLDGRFKDASHPEITTVIWDYKTVIYKMSSLACAEIGRNEDKTPTTLKALL